MKSIFIMVVLPLTLILCMITFFMIASLSANIGWGWRKQQQQQQQKGTAIDIIRHDMMKLRLNIDKLERELLYDGPTKASDGSSMVAGEPSSIFTMRPPIPSLRSSTPHLPSRLLPSPAPPSEKLFRDDGRCGPQYPLYDGRPAECNPWEFPCCSISGWCGETEFHCECPECKNYAVADCVTRIHCGKDTSCDPILVQPAVEADKIIIIASAWIGPQRRFTDAKRNHVRYALKHGYGYFAVECNWSDRGFPHWSKILIMSYLMETFKFSYNRSAEYVFWMDADSLFMNSSIGIEDHLIATNPHKDFIFSGEREMIINTGHFLLRNSNWSLTFLDEVYRMYPSPGFVEQGSVIAYLAGATSKDSLGEQKAKFSKLLVSSVSSTDAERAQALVPHAIRSHIKVVPMKIMNSYLNIYTPGDWILHFSGVSDKRSTTAK